MKDYSVSSWSVKCRERDRIAGSALINKVHISCYCVVIKQPGGILGAQKSEKKLNSLVNNQHKSSIIEASA